MDLLTPTLIARGLCRGWVRLYTAGLPLDERERRIAEIEADVWEQTAETAGGWPRVRCAAHVVVRLLLGIPADVTWSTDVAQRRGHVGNGSRWSFARTALLVAAPVYGVAGAAAALDGLPAGMATHQSLVLMGSTLALAVVLLGAWLIPRAPRLGAVIGLPGLIWLVDLVQIGWF